MESDCVRLAYSPARSNASAQRSPTAPGTPGGMKACAYSWTCESMMSSIIRAVDRCHRHISPAWMPKADVDAQVPTRCLWQSCCGTERLTEAQPWSRKHRPVQSALVACAVVVQQRVVHGATAGFAVLNE